MWGNLKNSISYISCIEYAVGLDINNQVILRKIVYTLLQRASDIAEL